MIHTDHLDYHRLPRDRRPDPATVGELVAVRRPRRLWPRRLEWQAVIVTAVIAALCWLTVARLPEPETEAGPLVVHTDCSGAVREAE